MVGAFVCNSDDFIFKNISEKNISAITKITISFILLWTSITTAKVSISICARIHGTVPFDSSFTAPNVNVFPRINK